MVSLVPKSQTIIAQTAPPSQLSVAAGTDRRAFLARLGMGTASISSNPTLGGQTHDDTDNRAGQGMSITKWIWDESTLQTAGIVGSNPGNLAIAGFAETGITEYIWITGTIQNTEQSDAVAKNGRSIGADTVIDIPTTPANFSYPDAGRQALHLQLWAMKPAAADFDSDWYETYYVTDLAQTSYRAWLLTGISDELAQYLHPVSGMTGALGSIVQYPDRLAKHEYDGGKPLPIHRPRYRSITSDVIADRYNMGLPKQEDYNFRGRKFYQNQDN